MTAAALSNELKSILTRAGVDDPAGDASLILESILGCTRAMLIARYNEEIAPELVEKAVAMAERRAIGEPIQYVLGEWSFMGREYIVGEGSLIPRDDTEVVVNAAFQLIKYVPSPVVIDLCSGTGIIAVTLKKEIPSAKVSAVEKSEEAFAYLERNAGLNNADIKLIHADLAGCADSFADASLDLLISNPPYIKSDDIAGLQREISYEPRLALDGGESGCDFYELIIRLWTKKLRPGGYIALELGEGQFDYVAALLTEYGYSDIKAHLDIQSIKRAITASLTKTNDR